MIYNGDYEIHYNGKLVCYIDTPNDKAHMWHVWTVGDYSNEYERFPIDERTKEIAWANVVYCGNCDDVDCDPGKTETIFGKEFVNVAEVLKTSL
jgi:nitrous oxide reductase